nr:ABC transporter ATP-binding protein [Acidimicrobiales bacterium]
MVNIGAASATRPGQVGLGVSGLTVAYDGPPVLVDVSLGVDPGEIVALLGPSGSGKTTLLRSIAGLEKPASGSVFLGERIVSDHQVFLAPERRRVGMVFQDGALFPHLDVSRNVAYGLPRAERSSDRVTEALRMVGLESMAHRMPGSLSGGQRQRVALARALAPRPGVLLLDEPFSNLDATLRLQVRAEIHQLLVGLGITTLFVTHD